MSTWSELFEGESSGDGYRQNQRRGLSAASGIGQQFGALGQQYGIGRQRFDNQADAALNHYVGDLSRGTSDAQRAGYVSRQSAPVEDEYLRARSRLQSTAAQSGNAGLFAGASANLEASQAGALAQARSGAGDYFDQLRRASLGQVYDLLQSRGNNYASREASSLGQAGSFALNTASAYGNMAQAEEARRAQEQAQMLGLITTAGQGIGAAAGLKG